MPSVTQHAPATPGATAFRQARTLRSKSMSCNTRCRGSIHCRAAADAGSSMSIHIGETTISFPFKREQAQELSGSVRGLLETFAEKQKAERPKRWNMMEYRLKGDPGAGALQSLEVFCNPNAYTTAFDAKVLITLATAEGVKVTTEGRLSALKSDVDTFLDSSA